MSDYDASALLEDLHQHRCAYVHVTRNNVAQTTMVHATVTVSRAKTRRPPARHNKEAYGRL